MDRFKRNAPPLARHLHKSVMGQRLILSRNEKMLVLSRKIDDEIIIDETICVRVLKVKGNTVRIGISAPNDVSIMRGELRRREIEFTIETEEEPEPNIRFEQFAPLPPQQSRLGEIAARLNRQSR